MPDGHDHAAAGSPPTPEERADKAVKDAYGFNSNIPVHPEVCKAIGRAIRAAVAAELEAVAAHFEECDRLDPSEWFPPKSVAEYVRGRVAAIRARGETTP
jgi:hypothetical protein